MNDRDDVVREMRQLAEAGEGPAAWQLYDWATRLQEQGKVGKVFSRQSQSMDTPLYTHSAPAPVVTVDVDAFTEWMVREMPPGTVIGSPRWWAPKIIGALVQP